MRRSWFGWDLDGEGHGCDFGGGAGGQDGRLGLGGWVAVDAAAVFVVLGGGEEPDEVDGEFLGCFVEFGFGWVAGDPEVFGFLVEPVSTGEVDVPCVAVCVIVSMMNGNVGEIKE